MDWHFSTTGWPPPPGRRWRTRMTSAADHSPRHKRNRRGEGQRLREKLIAATNRLLSEGATHDTLSLRAVARAAGIATTSVYLHFPDKMALLLAVYYEHFIDLGRHLQEATAAHAEPADKVRALVSAYCQFAVDHPDVYRVLSPCREQPNHHVQYPPRNAPGYPRSSRFKTSSPHASTPGSPEPPTPTWPPCAYGVPSTG